MLYKDAANEKSNQRTWEQSAHPTYVQEYLNTPPRMKWLSVISIALPKFVNMSTGEFDHQSCTKLLTTQLATLTEVINVNSTQ